MKNYEKNYFFVSLKINEKKESDPDPLVRGTDPGIRIPNTEINTLEKNILYCT
jgi:hypothetical protein